MRLNRTFIILLLLSGNCLLGDMARFLDPLDFEVSNNFSKDKYKASAFESSMVPNNAGINSANMSQRFELDQALIEDRLGEALAYRYQASGEVVAFLTRKWIPEEVSSNFIVKILDCSPDELVSSTFVRFDIWDNGDLIGRFSEPLRIAHMVEVFVSNSPLVRGNRLSASGLKIRSVDVLRQFAGAVPVKSKLSSYQLNSNLRPGTVLKWNNLSKITLVQKGKIVDVFASGNGIYVTMKGMALEDGVEGGMVKIRNLSSEKEFQAKVLNENSVKVHL